jgi:septal ring factor EnvC (AmiA/AmiB activator)
MDLSLIGAATTALSAAMNIGKSAIGVRDFNQMATAIAQVNEQLLKAQESLFSHQTQLLTMQQELFGLKDTLRQKESALIEAQDEIAKLKQKKLELDQYERFLHAGGRWAYRKKDASPDNEDEPAYCANCFEHEQLSVLQPGTGQINRSYLVCHRCDSKIRRS